jgi:hypothetical protein
MQGFHGEKLNVLIKETDDAGITESQNESRMSKVLGPFAKSSESDESGERMETDEASTMVSFLRDVDLESSDDENLEQGD